MASLKYHILKEYANGVMDERGRFFPYKFSYSADVPAKVNIRHYLKSVQVSANKAGATVATNVACEVIVKGYNNKIVNVYVPETFAASNDCITIYCEPCVLCDLNTQINITTSGSNTIIVVYAEIDEIEGEYSG